MKIHVKFPGGGEISIEKEPMNSDRLVKLVRTEASRVETPLYITIPDHLTVRCFGQPHPDARFFRQVYYEAKATDVPGWGEKVQLGFEEAQIAMRTRFQENQFRESVERGEHYGVIDGDMAIINRTVWNKACEEAGLSPKALLGHLKSKGMIITGSKGYTKTKRIDGVSVHCVWMRLPPDDEEPEEYDELPL